jgi:hypothetical protein
MPDPHKKTIILIDISEENYSFKELYHRITQRVSSRICPCCMCVGRFRRHGRYEKYHYKNRIAIVRIKCVGCGTTHAVIPSFSLPGTSVGTGEVEQYLKTRHAGMSRRKAAEVFSGLGLHEEYPRHLERMFDAAVLRVQALLGDESIEWAGGYAWVLSRMGRGTQRPVWELNILCGNRGYNPVFFSRSSILVFPTRKTGIRISHHMPSAETERMNINSS